MSIPVPMRGFGGGGGAALNFDVKAYATEEALLADTPKENTIGIITTNKITGWMFAAADPAEPVEGMVYITTGTESDIVFNALKKNGIMVYPISAQQYVNGAWVDVTAMSYRGGEWVEWITDVYLYNAGDKCMDVTGGWTFEKYDDDESSFETDHIYIDGFTSSESREASVYTKNKINTEGFKTLIVNVNIDSRGDYGFYFGLSNENNNVSETDFVAYTKKNTSGTHTLTLDLSKYQKSYYVKLYCGVATAEVYKVILME